ncbi:hypothetical protein NQ318_001652 [Aromia moschata]|uniref:Maturase K n=1 Tax=Aromia moschata TaxID=1265417 RepID=A0AAV8XYV3_9CUCU|nr:hypothetical protein NQ318_001652 [Aromia moschata]
MPTWFSNNFIRQILTDIRRPYNYTQIEGNLIIKIFRNLYNRLGETGFFRPKSNHGTPKTITVDEEVEILIHISENPGLVTRRLNSDFNSTELNQSPICRNLKKEMLHPYHYTPVQQPFELPPNLTGPRYLNFLQHNNELLENYANIYMSIFSHRWIGRGSESFWPRISSDLNPLDFSVWSNLKDLVYPENERHDPSDIPLRYSPLTIVLELQRSAATALFFISVPPQRKTATENQKGISNLAGAGKHNLVIGVWTPASRSEWKLPVNEVRVEHCERDEPATPLPHPESGASAGMAFSSFSELLFMASIDSWRDSFDVIFINPRLVTIVIKPIQIKPIHTHNINQNVLSRSIRDVESLCYLSNANTTIFEHFFYVIVVNRVSIKIRRLKLLEKIIIRQCFAGNALLPAKSWQRLRLASQPSVSQNYLQ